MAKEANILGVMLWNSSEVSICQLSQYYYYSHLITYLPQVV